MSNFDEALERLHLVDFEYAGGLANHGPMAVQALVDLGHAALIPAFVDRYVPRVPPAPIGRVLSPSEQSAARGNPARVHDWVATFEARLADANPLALVREVVPELLPGLFAAAGHGLLRTVHALRALAAEDNALRRSELARGLAYWTATAQSLPAVSDPTLLAATRGPRERFESLLAVALEGLASNGTSGASVAPRAPIGRPAPDEPFTVAVRRLEVETVARSAAAAGAGAGTGAGACAGAAAGTNAGAGGAGARIDGPDALLAALVRVAARLYWTHPEARIAFAHAVTIPAALRWLLRRLPAEIATEGARQALAVVAAFQALYGQADRLAKENERPLDAEVLQTARSWDEIRYRAACSLKEHAIKLACACLLEERESAHPALARAAADAALRIDGVRGAC